MKYIVLLFFLFCVSANAEWIKGNPSENGSVTFTKVEKKGDSVFTYFITNFKSQQNVQGKYFLSEKVVYEYDCFNNVTYSNSFTIYPELYAQGAPLDKSEIKQIVPGIKAGKNSAISSYCAGKAY
jgi:hypothetical protein